MEYDYENPITGELETLEIDYTITPTVNETRDQPSEGGECEFTATNEAGENITNELSCKVCEDIRELCYEDQENGWD